jgi:5-formyltetrahydrofolate cyclo-ligase
MMRGKAEVRKEIQRKLKAQSAKIKTEKDKIIQKKVLALGEFKRAKVTAVYISLPSEVETGALIDEALAAGKRVAAPVINGKALEFYEIRSREEGLEEGPCGILQPAKGSGRPFRKEKFDMIIVPGTAFTKAGARLGRGKGFYDRYLKDMPEGVTKVALAYDIQILEDLPVTPNDIPVDIVLTN